MFLFDLFHAILDPINHLSYLFHLQLVNSLVTNQYKKFESILCTHLGKELVHESIPTLHRNSDLIPTHVILIALRLKESKSKRRKTPLRESGHHHHLISAVKPTPTHKAPSGRNKCRLLGRVPTHQERAACVLYASHTDDPTNLPSSDDGIHPFPVFSAHLFSSISILTKTTHHHLQSEK